MPRRRLDPAWKVRMMEMMVQLAGLSSYLDQRRPSPWIQNVGFRFPPYFRKICFRCSPYFQKISKAPSKIFPVLPFPTKNFDFHPPKFLMTFFEISPSIFVLPPKFPPVSTKSFIPLYFAKFSSDFVKFSYFVHAFCDFRFPLLLPWCIYASHNARTGRPCRGLGWWIIGECKSVERLEEY